MSYTIEEANSVVTVDLAKVKRNIERIRAHIGPNVDIMYTAKSNGYGHGLIEPTLYMRDHCGIHCFATGQLCEAVELRQAGIEDFILVMGGIPYSGVPSFVKNNFVATVYEDTLPRALNEEAAMQGKKVRVHIKIDTGLRRFGVQPGEQLAHLIETLKALPHLEIDGVYTHLANGYSLDKSFTHQQMAEFEKALAQLKEAGIRPRLVHAANTAACVASPECYYDVVRVAALIFGYDISPAPRTVWAWSPRCAGPAGSSMYCGRKKGRMSATTVSLCRSAVPRSRSSVSAWATVMCVIWSHGILPITPMC